MDPLVLERLFYSLEVAYVVMDCGRVEGQYHTSYRRGKDRLDRTEELKQAL